MDSQASGHAGRSGFAGTGHRRDFAQLLRQAEEVLSSMGAFDEGAESSFRIARQVERVRELRETYEEPYRIAVMGEFKAGKSAFINSLLGRRGLLPEGGTETTAVVTELLGCGDDEEETGLVRFRGDRAQLGPLSLLDAGRYADKRNPVYDRDPALRKAVDSVRLVVRSPLLRNVLLIDTPGFGKTKEQADRTLAMLHTADAVLWVFDANHIGGDLARDILSRVVELRAKVVVVLSQADFRLKASAPADRAKQRQAVLDDLAASDIADIVSGCETFVYSATAVLDAKENNDEDALRRWEHDELLSHLHLAFLSDAAPTVSQKLEKRRGSLKRLIADTMQALDVAVVRADAASTEFQSHLTDAQQRVYREIHSRIPSVETKIDDMVAAEVSDFFAGMQQALELLIESRMDLSVDALVGAVKALGAKFNKRLRLRMSNEIVQEFRQLFPERMEHILRDNVARKAARLLEAEWQTAANAAISDVAAQVELGPVLNQIAKHLVDVTVKAAATAAATVALLFVPGGALFDAIALLASGGLLKGALAKTRARTERAKNLMRLQLRNQRRIASNDICSPLYDANRLTAGKVEAVVLEHKEAWEQGAQEAFEEADRCRGWSRRLDVLLATVEEFGVQDG